MHKKYFNFILPLLGAAVVVGSGFSAWVFSDVEAKTADLNGTIAVEPLQGLTAELTLDTTSFKLNLDQGGVGNTQSDAGIYFYDDSTLTQLEVTLTYTLHSDAAFEAWENVSCAYSVTYALDGNIAEYLNASDIAKTEITTTDTDASTRTYTQSFVLSFTYADGKKPKNADEYAAMKTAAEGSSVTVTVSVETEIA